MAAKITELESKLYSLELAHVTDTFKKECQLPREASNCSESQADGGGEIDQFLDTFQVFDHSDTTNVV